MYGDTDNRLDALKAVCERYHVETAQPQRFTSAEDLAPFFKGEEEIKRFVAVTESHASGDVLTYAYPYFDNVENAQSKALRHVNDDLYPESGIAVVDLDEGTVLRPNDVAATWTEAA